MNKTVCGSYWIYSGISILKWWCSLRCIACIVPKLFNAQKRNQNQAPHRARAPLIITSKVRMNYTFVSNLPLGNVFFSICVYPFHTEWYHKTFLSFFNSFFVSRFIFDENGMLSISFLFRSFKFNGFFFVFLNFVFFWYPFFSLCITIQSIVGHRTLPFKFFLFQLYTNVMLSW